MTDQYTWTDNPTQSGVAICDTDILNDCLMHLKYDKSGSGSGLELCDIGTALYVDESKGLRRYLNGQIVDINTNTQAWLNRLLAIQTTNPEYFTTETNWQAEKALNVDGVVDKYVLNYDEGTNVISVRLPKYPDYVEISVGGTLPVQGNGTTIGLTNNINNFGMGGGEIAPTNLMQNMMYDTRAYGTSVGTNESGTTASNAFRSVGLTTDPTKSGITATLKQTKLKLRYFTQIATGQETENNIVNDIELNNPYVLFRSEYSEAPLYNLSWLKSDGEYKPKATYLKAYEALVVENNSSIAVGTTVDLPSGTKYTKRGLSVKLSTASDITDYDFVINTTGETFRLPLKNGMEGLFADRVKGNGTNIALIDGSDTYGTFSTYSGSDGFCVGTNNQVGVPIGKTGGVTAGYTGRALGLTTDPTKSGMVVDKTVPPGYNLYYYVGETVQNSNLINAGRIGEELGNKLSRSDVAAYVVKTYSNGSSWYRIYSDNWCEQGGIATLSAGQTLSISLMKAYTNINYSILQSMYTTNNQDVWGYGNKVASVTTSSFSLYNNNSTSGNICWRSSGYIA